MDPENTNPPPAHESHPTGSFPQESHPGSSSTSSLPDPTASEPAERKTPATGIDPLSSASLTPNPILAAPQPRQEPEAPPKDPNREAERRRRMRYLVTLPLITILLAALTGIGVAASIRKPEVESLDFSPRLVTRLLDRSGEQIQTYSRENRVLLTEGEVPKLLENAILAVEDANFHQHGGIDLKGILRALVTNLRAGEVVEGASTITMQLARDLFALTRQQKVQRKIEEAFLAVELEKKFSKPQILTMYCNQVNLSQGNYGMQAAARSYFGKDVSDLTLAEAATLAGIPQRPSYHNPYARPEAVRQRRNVVLSRMLAESMITREEYQAAVEEPLDILPRRKGEQLGPYFTEEVRRYLISTYGETELYDRGLQVETTLDPPIQRAAEEALRTELARLDKSKGWRPLEDPPAIEDLESHELPSWRDLEVKPGPDWYEGLVLESDRKKARVKIADQVYELDSRGVSWTRRRPDQLLKPGHKAWFRLEIPEKDREKEDAEAILHLEQEPLIEGAALVLESETGAVRALVGGWSYDRNEFNRITQARRQVGSAMKPFVFGAALEIGFTAADTLFDGPVVFRGADNLESYSPRNYYRTYEGVMTLREALERSVNVPAVKLLDIVGVERVIDFARRCGLVSELPPYPSLALGAADLTPMELAASYAAIVNQGVYVEPYMIESIRSRDGQPIQEHQPQAHKAMDPQVAYVLTSMLKGVATRGTAIAHLGKLPIDTGGKTGTTNSFTDAWFVGFTPRYTLLTWVGYDQKKFLGRGWTGAHAALPIWTGIVQRGLEDGWLEEGETFAVPPGIVELMVEKNTGLLAGNGSVENLSEVFIEGTEPKRTFGSEWIQISEMPWYLQEPFYLPKEDERMPSQVSDWSAVLESWGDRK